MFVRRRPLLRGAMIGGAGYLAGRGAARASEREQEQPAPTPAAAPAPAAGGDLVSQLQELETLQDEGVLTPDEFEAAKRQLLAG
jgi:hypothetical protein